MEVSTGAVRNSSTASRNSSAPRRTARRAPPSRRTNPTSAVAARCNSSLGSVASPSASRGSCMPQRRAAATAKDEKLTRTAPPRTLGGATIARCLMSPYSSRNRAPSPAIHSRIVSGQTPCRLAASLTRSPPTTAPTAEKTTSTPVTLPGRASHGSTRSRCPHVQQRASATASEMQPTRTCSFRPTRVRISLSVGPSQRPQWKPRSIRCPPSSLTAASTAASYLVDSMSST